MKTSLPLSIENPLNGLNIMSCQWTLCEFIFSLCLEVYRQGTEMFDIVDISTVSPRQNWFLKIKPAKNRFISHKSPALLSALDSTGSELLLKCTCRSLIYQNTRRSKCNDTFYRFGIYLELELCSIILKISASRNNLIQRTLGFILSLSVPPMKEK